MLLQASPDTANPARARGLRRARTTRAPCEPIDPTPMPDPVDAAHTLALLTRVRATQIAAGKLTDRGLYDVRAFKSAWAELGYLRRLAAVGKTGGTVVTSMPQLVSGLARLHPAWRMDGEQFADRDRHHSAVRRRLRNLQAMGLLTWRIGIDADGEDARTELELKPAPDVGVEELATATARLKRWRVRYGPALNTGSSTGIRSAALAARPLSACEREQRGRARAIARAQRRRGEHLSTTDTAPRFAAPPTSGNVFSTEHLPEDDHACGLRTRVTRASASNPANPSAANNLSNNNCSLSTPENRLEAATPWDVQALLARVRAREQEREPVLAFIAGQVERRSHEVRAWSLERGWAPSRLQEAWVHARYGARNAAEWGASAAGLLEVDDYPRLRRAVARYERNTQARPTGFPAGGLAALTHLGELAAAGWGGPRTLRYAIGALDQLSRRMRAVHTDTNPKRLQRAVRLARQRHAPDEPRTPIAYRLPGSRWPRWVKLTSDGRPLIVDDELQIQAGWAPAYNSAAYRAVTRDAHLVARGEMSPEFDGRSQMSDKASRYDIDTETRQALPGPYPAPEARSSAPVDRDIAELAHHSDLSLEQAAQVAPDIRDELLARIRAEQASRVREEQAALHARLVEIAESTQT